LTLIWIFQRNTRTPKTNFLGQALKVRAL